MPQKAQILDGKKARLALEEKLKRALEDLGFKPHLVIILAGQDQASEIYVSNKKKFGEEVGCEVSVEKFSEKVTREEIINKIHSLNADRSVHGIIVQSPLPNGVPFQSVVDEISPEKDVDGLRNGSAFVPATARGIMSLLDFYNLPVSGQRAVVIGRSKLVGLPTSLELMKRDATVTICHKKTSDLPTITKFSDILIVSAGVPGLIGKEHVSEGQVVIDVGIHRSESGLVGDVKFEEVSKIVGAITPVPGGVGPMTVLSLFENLYDAARACKSGMV